MSDANPFELELRQLEKSGELAKYRERLELYLREHVDESYRPQNAPVEKRRNDLSN